MEWLGKRYHSLNAFLRNKFGERVHRISLDAGFTCPNRDGLTGEGGCIYCAEEGARASYVNPAKSVHDQLLSGMETMKKRTGARKFIAYFQAYTNTYAEPDVLKSIYSEALSHQDVIGISIGTRPDCIDAGKLDAIESAADGKYTLIEYGAQSMKEDTLEFIRRGHSAADTAAAIKLTRKREGIDVLAHLILGLPGETAADMINSVKSLLELGVDAFKFHHLYVEKGTALEKLYQESRIRLLSLEETLEILVNIIAILPERIVVHRLFGDCSRDRLVAPLWTLDKTKNLAALDQMLTDQGITQGKGILI